MSQPVVEDVATWPDGKKETRILHPNGGYTYYLDGLHYVHSSRCRLCHEFGRYADTEICPDCEGFVSERATAAAENEREACCADVCSYCAKGLPVVENVLDNDFAHRDGTNIYACKAWAIRKRSQPRSQPTKHS